MPRRLTNLRVLEVSGVDRGAGENVKVVLMKRDQAGQGDVKAYLARNLFLEAAAQAFVEKRKFKAKERRQLATSGAAMSDGSFPIENECLTGDTPIPLLDGRSVLLAEVESGSWAYGYDTTLRAIVPVQIEKVWLTKRAVPVLNVVLDSGESVRCTGNHPFLMRDGTYKAAADLKCGDSLMPFYRKVKRVNGRTEKPLLREHVFQPFWGVWEQTHRMVYRGVHDELPEGRDIHHVDDDPANNQPDNLEALTDAEHRRAHFALDPEHFRRTAAKGRAARWSKPGARERQSAAMVRDNAARREDGRIIDISAKIKAKKTGQWRVTLPDDLVARYEGGQSLEQIAKEFDVARASVTRRLKRLGLEIRKPHVATRLGRDPKTGRYANHKVVAVVSDGAADVYDLSVPRTHNVALGVGIFVHNSDLKNAIRAVGRASNPGRARSHIMSRARALGLSSLIPNGWEAKAKKRLWKAIAKIQSVLGVTVEKSLDFNTFQAGAEAKEYADGMLAELCEACCSLRQAVCSIMADDGVTDKMTALAASLKQFHDHLGGMVPEGIEQALQAAQLSAQGTTVNAQGAVFKESQMADPNTFTKEQMDEVDEKRRGQKARRKEAEKAAEVATKRADTAESRLAALLSMSPTQKAWLDHPDNMMTSEQRLAFLDMKVEKRETMVAAAPVEKMTEARLAGLPADVRDELIKSREFRKTASEAVEAGRVVSLTKRATDLGLPDAMGPHFAAVQKSCPDAWVEIDKVFDAFAEQVSKGSLFKEFGTTQQIDENSAIGKMGTRVEEMMKADKTIRSRESAIAKIASSPDQGDQQLWQDYKAETNKARVAA